MQLNVISVCLDIKEQLQQAYALQLHAQQVNIEIEMAFVKSVSPAAPHAPQRPIARLVQQIIINKDLQPFVQLQSAMTAHMLMQIEFANCALRIASNAQI